MNNIIYVDMNEKYLENLMWEYNISERRVKKILKEITSDDARFDNDRR